jgi:hypothetical protein
MLAPRFSSLSLFLSAGKDLSAFLSNARVACEAHREAAERPLPRPQGAFFFVEKSHAKGVSEFSLFLGRDQIGGTVRYFGGVLALGNNGGTVTPSI